MGITNKSTNASVFAASPLASLTLRSLRSTRATISRSSAGRPVQSSAAHSSLSSNSPIDGRRRRCYHCCAGSASAVARANTYGAAAGKTVSGAHRAGTSMRKFGGGSTAGRRSRGTRAGLRSIQRGSQKRERTGFKATACTAETQSAGTSQPPLDMLARLAVAGGCATPGARAATQACPTKGHGCEATTERLCKDSFACCLNSQFSARVGARSVYEL
jgi:hypothetical protein